jgi:thioredoxin reductase
MPGRGPAGITAAPQAHLRELDAVITGLSRVGLSLQAALDQPAQPAIKRIEEALDELDDVISQIRGTLLTAPNGANLPPAPRPPQ